MARLTRLYVSGMRVKSTHATRHWNCLDMRSMLTRGNAAEANQVSGRRRSSCRMVCGKHEPGAAVSILVKEHSDIAPALAARLAIRECEGRTLMQPATEVPSTQHGLASWIANHIRSLHRLRG